MWQVRSSESAWTSLNSQALFELHEKGQGDNDSNEHKNRTSLNSQALFELHEKGQSDHDSSEHKIELGDHAYLFDTQSMTATCENVDAKLQIRKIVRWSFRSGTSSNNWTDFNYESCDHLERGFQRWKSAEHPSKLMSDHAAAAAASPSGEQPPLLPTKDSSDVTAAAVATSESSPAAVDIEPPAPAAADAEAVASAPAAPPRENNVPATKVPVGDTVYTVDFGAFMLFHPDMSGGLPINREDPAQLVEKLRQSQVDSSLGSSGDPEIEALFKRIGVDLKHVKVFCENEIKVEDFASLTKDDLKDLIHVIGPRNRIWKYIEAVNKDKSTSTSKKAADGEVKVDLSASASASAVAAAKSQGSGSTAAAAADQNQKPPLHPHATSNGGGSKPSKIHVPKPQQPQQHSSPSSGLAHRQQKQQQSQQQQQQQQPLSPVLEDTSPTKGGADNELPKQQLLTRPYGAIGSAVPTRSSSVGTAFRPHLIVPRPMGVSVSPPPVFGPSSIGSGPSHANGGAAPREFRARRARFGSLPHPRHPNAGKGRTHPSTYSTNSLPMQIHTRFAHTGAAGGSDSGGGGGGAGAKQIKRALTPQATLGGGESSNATSLSLSARALHRRASPTVVSPSSTTSSTSSVRSGSASASAANRSARQRSRGAGVTTPTPGAGSTPTANHAQIPIKSLSPGPAAPMSPSFHTRKQNVGVGGVAAAGSSAAAQNLSHPYHRGGGGGGGGTASALAAHPGHKHLLPPSVETRASYTFRSSSDPGNLTPFDELPLPAPGGDDPHGPYTLPPHTATSPLPRHANGPSRHRSMPAHKHPQGAASAAASHMRLSHSALPPIGSRAAEAPASADGRHSSYLRHLPPHPDERYRNGDERPPSQAPVGTPISRPTRSNTTNLVEYRHRHHQQQHHHAQQHQQEHHQQQQQHHHQLRHRHHPQQHQLDRDFDSSHLSATGTRRMQSQSHNNIFPSSVFPTSPLANGATGRLMPSRHSLAFEDDLPPPTFRGSAAGGDLPDAFYDAEKLDSRNGGMMKGGPASNSVPDFHSLLNDDSMWPA